MSQRDKPANKFGLNVSPEPSSTDAGDKAHNAFITMEPRSVIPAHFHLSETGEIYVWIRGGSLHLFLQRPEGGPWVPWHLNARHNILGIPPYWRHGGVALGSVPLVFEAYSRVDHFRNNTHQLPDKEQPPHILFFMRRQKGFVS